MKLTYLGDGTAFVVGVPARNISETDWDELTEDLQTQATQSGLYVQDATPDDGEGS